MTTRESPSSWDAPLPDCAEVLARAHVVSIPLTTRFRGVSTREALLIEGTQAWSEFSPFLEYDTAESAAWLAGALEYAFDPTLPRHTSGTVAVNATIPAVDADAVPQLASRFSGCRTVKVKVAEPGQTLREDIERLLAVKDAFNEPMVRIDANGGWTVPEAEAALREITAAGIQLEYAEQPVRTLPELTQLRSLVHPLGIRIAADESIRKGSDPLAVARAGAADHAVVKVQPLGGVRSALRVVADSGMTATVSSALETSVGLVAGAGLAAELATRDEPFAAGLGTLALFAEDVCAAPRRPVNGSISLAPAVPDAGKLRALAASAGRRDWWFDRLRDCYEHLVGSRGSGHK